MNNTNINSLKYKSEQRTLGHQRLVIIGFSVYVMYLGFPVLLGLVARLMLMVANAVFSMYQYELKGLQEFIINNSGMFGIIVQSISSLAIIAWFITRANNPSHIISKEFMGIKSTSIKYILLSVALGIVVAGTFILSVYFSKSIDIARLSGSVMVRAFSIDWKYIILFISIIFITPISEEFVFRGIILKCFSESWPVPIAIMVTSIMFIGIHLYGVLYYWPLGVAIAMQSIIAAIYRLKSGSIIPSISIHIVYNITILVFAQ